MTDPVTITVRRKVRPGLEAAYEAWLKRLTEGAARDFPGYLGAEFHRPGPDGTYRSVFRFDSLPHLEAFERSDFRAHVNAQMVELEQVTDAAEAAELRRLIERHHSHTGSDLARRVLDGWDEMLPKFVRVIPRDYQRMLAAIARAEEQGLVGEEAIMVAFEENARDLARVGGN